MARRLVTALAGTTLFLAVFPASAVDASATIRYEAPATCPDAREFMKRVGQRTERARVALPDEDATVVVNVESAESGFRARMSLSGPAGATTREVSGADCDSVSSAMALITALAIESAAHNPVPPAAPTCAPPAPTPTPPAPRLEAPGREPVWGLGGSVQGMGAVAPELMRLSEHFIEFSPGATSVRLSYVHGSVEDVQGDFRARTRIDVGRLGFCRGLIGLASWTRLSACLAASVGAVRVEGEAARRISATRAWADASVTARWQVRVLGPVWVCAEAGAMFPAVRYSYEFRSPDAEFHQTSAVAPLLALGLRLSLP